jgi:hypothetical protein
MKTEIVLEHGISLKNSTKVDSPRHSMQDADLQRHTVEATEMALGGTESKFQPGNMQQKESRQTTGECRNIFEDCTS